MRNSILTSPDSSGSHHAPGEILAGKYQMVELLGEGGMGSVWRAHSLLLDIDVALKVLHREFQGLDIAERLLREARATASLEHPAIVRVLDFGEMDTGEPFLVMEFLAGMSLARWLRERGRMSAAQAVQMLLPIAGGIAAAHARGVIHRDIKPENIIVVGDAAGTCQPKIVDFGIAKWANHRGPVITQAGMVLGSLEYMSPEQANGDLDVGQQTDVWALCVVLYELITGRRPFKGPTVAALAFALYTAVPTPTTQFAAGDEELWKIIERGLQKLPAERWPDMRALGRALSSWALERGITSDVAGASLTHNWPMSASEPPGEPESAVRTSVSRTSVAPPRPRAPSITVGAPIETPVTLNASPAGGTPPLRRMKALRVVALVALVLAPGVVAAGLYDNHGSASADERPISAAAPARGPAAPPPPVPSAIRVAASIPSAPHPAESPSAITAKTSAGRAAPASKPRDHRAAPAARQKRSPTAMPLPSAPPF